MYLEKRNVLKMCSLFKYHKSGAAAERAACLCILSLVVTVMIVETRDRWWGGARLCRVLVGKPMFFPPLLCELWLCSKTRSQREIYLGECDDFSFIYLGRHALACRFGKCPVNSHVLNQAAAARYNLYAYARYFTEQWIETDRGCSYVGPH